MKCKECKKREAVIKSAVVSISYKHTAIEIVCDDVCLRCLEKALKRKSTMFKKNPIEKVKIKTLKVSQGADKNG